jgi:hypothetical protein
MLVTARNNAITAISIRFNLYNTSLVIVHPEKLAEEANWPCS